MTAEVKLLVIIHKKKFQKICEESTNAV